MIESIKRFFTTRVLGEDEPRQDPAHRARLATAALLVEVARADFAEEAAEFQAVREAVGRVFDLSTEEVAELVALARAELGAATSHFEFVQLVNAHFSPERKAELIEAMWHVSFADARLDKYEEHLIRRLANLLHVSHGEFIAAKLRAARSLR
jgi:uncharacterized tellurite resistance protein B-like protein